MEDIKFEKPLVEGIIEKRKSQFTMLVDVDGKTGVACHCPTTGRMQRHVGELAKSLESHQRAIFLVCCLYDNPGFQVVEKSTNYDEVKRDMDAARERGVEMWQANFKIDSKGVKLIRYFPIEV